MVHSRSPRCRARVVAIGEKGYGSALLGGIHAARGRYVIMGDSNDSYDFSRLEGFIESLRGGYQLVMGNRFLGGIAPGAMPPLHRYLGNPVLSTIGLAMMIWLLPAPRRVAGVTLDIHTLFYAALAVVVGFHSMLFSVFTKVYGIRKGIVPPDPHFSAIMRLVTLEVGLIAGGALLLFGLALGVYALGEWGRVEFGTLSPERAMRLVIPSGIALLLAFQIGYGAFFLSVLEIRSNRSAGR
jgi:hypothetical protein